VTDKYKIVKNFWDRSKCGPVMMQAQVAEQAGRIFLAKVCMRMLDAVLGRTS